MQHCENNHIDAFILDLDFNKCFDRIATECVYGAMRFFQIPEQTVKWVAMLYKNFTIRIQNNGKFSEKVSIQKSVHQGGCMSVQLFLLCAELLAIKMRESKHIKGIPVHEIIYMLNQYADDTGAASLFDQMSLDAMINCLEDFRMQSGFTINYEKTSLLRIGSLAHSDAKFIYAKKYHLD